MSVFSDGLSERFMVFVMNIMGLEKQLCLTFSCRHIYSQLYRAATSCGANYEEARAGESRDDFIHKMQEVLKEQRESLFWIRLISKSNLDSKDKDVLVFLFNETTELSNIVAKSILTAKSNRKKLPPKTR